MMIEQKIWGTANHVLYSDDIGISYLTVEKLTRCSIHYHSERWNAFQVTEGKIRVHTFDHLGGYSGDFADKDRWHYTDLGEGGYIKVEPKILHCFEVLETGKVVEVYWGNKVDFGDITRFDVGEKLEKELMPKPDTIKKICEFAREKLNV